MGPIRRSRGVNKRYSYYNEESPIRHGESADRRSRQKRMLFDPLGPRWSKEEIELFYELYRKHGKDWRKVAVGMRNRSIEMVEALYSTNRAYLSLPEGTASVAGLIAMMTDHYANLDGSDNEKQSNDGPGTSQKPQKHGLGKAQAKFLKGSRGNLLSPSQEVASSYGHLQISKKKRSVGIRPRAVGKRTPRIPVSFSYENKNSEKLISPTKQGISKADSDDDELAEIAKTLTEVSHREGFLQVSLTPRRVGRCDINEDGSNQGTEADNGDFPRTNNFRMRDGNVGTSSQNGKRRYGNKTEAYNGKNQLDEIREACSGTGQMLDAEVTNAKFSRSSHDSRKRSKKVLFGRDKGSDLHPLEFLADCSLMPETENDNEASVQLKEVKNYGDMSEFLKAMPETHCRDECQLSGIGVKENRIMSREEHAINKTFKPEKVPVFNILEVEARGNTQVSGPLEVDVSGKSVERMSMEKGRRSSESTPTAVKHSENSSPRTGPRKEGGDSATPTVDVLAANQVDKISKGRRKRKMIIQKPKDKTSVVRTFVDQPTVRFPSPHERGHNLEKRLSNCISNHLARRWCTFEWFYSAVDYPWFAKREFVEYLSHVGLGHVPRLTRVEWGVIRSSLGKPRRFSVQFLKEEKEKLNHYRNSVRTQYSELRQGSREGLPADLARPLSVGQRVIAIHPKTREIHDGSVLTVEHSKCRVQFDQPELGVEFVTDIDCMPTNPVENMPTSLSSHIIAVDNYRKSFNDLKVNGHTKDQRAQGYTKYSIGEYLAICNGDPDMLPSTYPFCNLFKQTKVASSIVNAQAQILSNESLINHQTAYSQPPVHAQIEPKEADVQAISKLTHALEKKSALVLEWGKLNNDVSENEKCGESDLKNSDVFKKQYAAVLKQLQEANVQVSSALCQLRQRNSYKRNLSLPWTRPTTNIGDSGANLSSFNSFDGSEESRTHVNDIIESSRLRAYAMVNSAIQAYASREGGGNTFEKIEEAIDHVNDQLSKDYPYILAERSFVAADAGNSTSHELYNPKSSSLQEPSSQKLKNLPVPSELITKCVATLLMIQNCTERQLPPADVARVLDLAVTSLQPCCSQNFPVYTNIEKCMIMIKNQIMALIPT
ncbi:Protein ALWAYS EARLY 3 [Heracleum sosnowskyi]|uniref:Protein ALWAYS EARLY 3 n=1 Tax=Heracleum sosnowskyi TaxID=360622 RepID=A0AAD8MUV7_9APIA|nr:Protein ALWAYS EARLY 3 [Heracleum sosnowskyi]